MNAFKHGLMVAATTFAVLSGVSGYCTFSASDFGFELQNGATAAVSVIVTPSGHGDFQYRYSVRNTHSSRQPIFSFSVQVDSASAANSMISPAGWKASGCCYVDDKRPGATGIKVTTWLFNDQLKMIPPGGSLSGYTLASAGIPGIKKYFIEGYTENDTPHFEGGSAEEENAVDNLSDFFNNSTSGMTLGPDVISSSMPVDALIDRLTALKHESATNGWLGDAKFVLKLDRRLGEAKAALAAGKPALARVRLTQFVHDLTVVHEEHGDAGRSRERGKERDERRREKFVNDDAYQLLKINADYIVAKLPEKAKGRDEEEECRRAEAETDGGGAKAGNGGRGSPGHDR